MGFGIAIGMVGFGGQRSSSYFEACHIIVTIVGKKIGYNKYSDLSFLQIPDEELLVYNMRSNKQDLDAAKKMVVLPTVKEFLDHWQDLLCDISTDLHDTIVTIDIRGVTEVAMNGKIFGANPGT